MSSEIVLLARRPRPRWRSVLAGLVVLAALLPGVVSATGSALATPPDHAGGGKGSGGGGSASDGGGKCHPKNGCASSDTTAPQIAITSPADGTSVSGQVSVTGTAADDTSLSSVAVSVDGSQFAPVTGTSDWSQVVDTAPWSSGQHQIVARAVDTAGNASEAAVLVDVAGATPTPDTSSSGDLSWTDAPVQNGAEAGYALDVVDRDAIATNDALGVTLYRPTFTNRIWARTRAFATGATSDILVWSGTASGWAGVRTALSPTGTLWVLGQGTDGMVLRGFELAGGTPPTSATLVREEFLGDADSRGGDLTLLDSGALAVVWHQQGDTGPQGLGVAHLGTDGQLSVQTVTGIRTKASKEVMVQHPADGSLWVFSNPDSLGQIQAVHMTETADGLSLDWVDDAWIADAAGVFDADPENPWVAAAADNTTGDIVLAYQSADREILSTSPFVAASRPAIARIAVDGSRSFTHAPDRIERVSEFGLTATGGSVWLAYRPVDTTDLSYDDVTVARLAGGVWSSATVGTLADDAGAILAAAGPSRDRRTVRRRVRAPAPLLTHEPGPAIMAGPSVVLSVAVSSR